MVFQVHPRLPRSPSVHESAANSPAGAPAGSRIVVTNRIERLRIGHPFQSVIDHPHHYPVCSVPPVFLRRKDVTQVRTIPQGLLHRQAQYSFSPARADRLPGRGLGSRPKPKKLRSAKHSMPFWERDQHLLGEGDFSRGIVAQARAPQHVGAILHQRDKAHLRVGTGPRLAAGRPKTCTFSFSSATSSVLPSRLTKRQPRYQAPGVLLPATGFTTSSCNCRSTAQPSWVRACDFHRFAGDPTPARGPRSHARPSSKQRNTSR